MGPERVVGQGGDDGIYLLGYEGVVQTIEADVDELHFQVQSPPDFPCQFHVVATQFSRSLINFLKGWIAGVHPHPQHPGLLDDSPGMVLLLLPPQPVPNPQTDHTQADRQRQ